jgi:hypothetical protein
MCSHLLKIHPNCKDNCNNKKAKTIKADLEVAEDKADPTDFYPEARSNSDPQSSISFFWQHYSALSKFSPWFIS